MGTQGRRSYSKYEEQLTDAIVSRLVKKEFFKRGSSQKTVFPEVLDVVTNFIGKDLDDKLDKNTVRRYNKGELRKDLIKEIKKGKVEAAKALMDLDNMKSATEDVIIIPMDFNNVEGLNTEEVLDEYLNAKESSENQQSEHIKNS